MIERCKRKINSYNYLNFGDKREWGFIVYYGDIRLLKIYEIGEFG